MILGINTATPRTSIALVNGQKTIYIKCWDSNCDEAEKLLPALGIVLKKRDIKLIDKIFTVRGPGSFTGLRVGITIANTLAYALSVPVTGCDTFDYYKNRIQINKRPKTAIMLRAGGVKVAIKLPGNAKIHRLEAEKLEEFFKRKKSIMYIVGDIRKDARKNFPLPKSIKWLEESALMTLADVIKQINKKDTTKSTPLKNQKIITPIYLSAPHITHARGA